MAIIPEGEVRWVPLGGQIEPLMVTVLSCDGECRECGLLLYHCRTECGRLQRICASMLMLPN